MLEWKLLFRLGEATERQTDMLSGFRKTADYDPAKIKEITGKAEESMAIEGKLVALAAWMKEHYGGTMIQALKTVLPVKKKEKIRQKRTVHLLLDEEAGKRQLDIYLHKNQKARARLLAGLLDTAGTGI